MDNAHFNAITRQLGAQGHAHRAAAHDQNVGTHASLPCSAVFDLVIPSQLCQTVIDFAQWDAMGYDAPATFPEANFTLHREKTAINCGPTKRSIDACRNGLPDTCRN
jgi:hypothetical protein